MGEMETKTWQKPSGIVIVKPILTRASGMIKDPKHEAFFLFGNATKDYLLPVDGGNNLINPFESEEEKKWLEESLGIDLGIHKRTDNYWKTAKVRCNKDDKRLDLSNPKDYLEYMILRANRLYIAPTNCDPKRYKATYKFRMVSVDYDSEQKAKSVNKKVEAYKYAGKLQSSKQAMMNFLKVYGKKVTESSKEDFLISTIDNIIENDLDKFLAIVKDTDYELRLFIENCVDAGIVHKKGRQYYLPGGEKLSAADKPSTIEEAVNFLQEKSNNDIYLSLEARLNNTKE